MSNKFRNKYRIPSARWQLWDYRWSAAYFVTICTHNRDCFFGYIREGKMVLSQVGIIADALWHEIKNHAKNVQLDAFVVMPNHIHGIIIINDVPAATPVETTHALSLPNDATATPVETTHALSLPNDATATPVETTHALSLPNDATATPVETTHALSLPTPGHLRFQHQGENSLSSIVGAYKSAVSKQAHRMGFKFAWQTRFHDHIIRNNESYQQISEYILANTKNWNEDKFYKDNPD